MTDKYLQELQTKKLECESCHTQMQLVYAPELFDGLGWGCDVFFLCLNNSCPSFIKSWKHIHKTTRQVGGYRVMQLPNESYQSVMAVLSDQAFTDRVVPEVVIKPKPYIKPVECNHCKHLPIKITRMLNPSHNDYRFRCLICEKSSGFQGTKKKAIEIWNKINEVEDD